MTKRSPRDIRVLVVHDRPETHIDIIEARFPDLPVGICRDRSALDDMLTRFAPGVVLSFKFNVNEPLPHDAIFACKSVRWVHVAGAGVDHLCRWDGGRVTLTNSAGVLSPYLAEYVMSAMLMANFGFPRYARQQLNSEWVQHPWRPIEQRTVLLVGLGRIGSRVAERAKNNGMRVLGVRSRDAPAPNVDKLYPPEDLPDAVAEADFVCLHVPLTDRTRGLIGADMIERMKPEAWLINTARGAVVDEDALIAALREKRIAGAIVDVFDAEPLPADSPLWALDNVVITPHVSDSIADWERPMTTLFCDNLDRWIAGRPLGNVVDPRLGY